MGHFAPHRRLLPLVASFVQTQDCFSKRSRLIWGVVLLLVLK
ncbi:hypothetical protein LINGRAHAP2_LOCUS19744 [Linum grandiflorum]